MNIMKVSSSKFTLLTLIAAVALAGASGMIFQDAHAAAITFTANHNSTTTTEIVFSEPVNGTLRLNDFVISPTVILEPEPYNYSHHNGLLRCSMSLHL